MDMKRCKRLKAAHMGTSEKEDWSSLLLQRLPLHMIYEILFKLPIESFFSCKCVCKTFYNILVDPQFAEIRLAQESNIDSGLIIQDRLKFSDVLLAYNYKHEIEGSSTVSPRPCQTFSPPTIADDNKHNVFCVGSCNGLLCIHFHEKTSDFCYFICNPVLGEFLPLPREIKPPLEKQQRVSFQPTGFGFCPKTKQYKVIRFLTTSCCRILTVGRDDSWRPIKSWSSSPPPYPLIPACFDNSFKGNLHWIIRDKMVTNNFICSFNLETEQSSILPTPNHLLHHSYATSKVVPSKHSKTISYVQTGSIGGLFSLGYRLNTNYYQICVMKDYGVKESWTVDFNIDLTSISGLERTKPYGYYPLGFSDSGDLFFNGLTNSLFCYNLRKGTLTSLLAKEVGLIGVTPFLPSLISLTAIALRGDVQVVQRRMAHNLWSNKGFHCLIVCIHCNSG